jgi:phospholipid/cholesterol/gamma-HCH transport system substrate-binding protein
MSVVTGSGSRRAALTARVVTLLALALAAVALAAIVFSGASNDYVVYAKFHDAGGLVTGFAVRIDGAQVGRVASLSLGHHDLAIAKLELDRDAAPIGRDATASIQAADLLGEKYVSLNPGNRRDPAPSGMVIPPSRTGLGVELDDVLNAFDPTTRDALRVFLSEQGVSYAGRRQDLAQLLSVLPPTLTQTQAMLSQFAQDNTALSRLVTQSNQVVGAVDTQRGQLTRLVGATAGTLSTLASRSAQLQQTVARAPGALVALHSALAALQGAALPLAPAAQGLANTAAPLTATLRELPAFATAAAPTLKTIVQVAPTLTRLGVQGTPVVTKLHSLTGELGTFSDALDPVTKVLSQGIGNILGVLEGWARATQTRDAASHVFRFGATVGPETISSLLPLLQQASAASQRHGAGSAAGNSHPTSSAAPATGLLPPIRTPALPSASSLAGGVTATLNKVSSTVNQLLGNVSGGHGAGTTTTGSSASKPGLQGLLNYLLK